MQTTSFIRYIQRRPYPSFFSCLILATVICCNASCKKFLNEKPDRKISTPQTLSDLDGMLDYYFGLNARFPMSGEVSADNFYLTDAAWAATNEQQRNLYLWQKYDRVLTEWSAPYNNIYYANVMLYNLNLLAIKPAEAERAGNIKGAAYFTRAINHFAVAQLFAPVYKKTTAATDLGIPLRLNENYNEPVVRVSVMENFNSIVNDLKQAIPLLPVNQPLKYRPGKAAAYGLLARVYLYMQEYQQAKQYADSCLSLYSTLIDYNSINTNAAIPFTQFNSEVIFDARSNPPSALLASRAKVDTNLFRQYEENDLRKTAFFINNADGSKAFKGNYTGLNNASLFSGIAVDEIYLIRAEALARLGNVNEALNDLNTLLRTRYKKINNTSTFTDKTATDATAALTIILTERRKQLLYRGLRWADLKRLNLEPAFAVTLVRTINNTRYELLPNSNRYQLQIDGEAIRLSTMEQNP